MTNEELERLYMDIYDNGIFDYDYKEKFKRYVNNMLESLERENAELKKSIKYVNTICERKSVTNSQLTELAADSSAKLWEAKKIIKKLLDFDFLPENEIKKQAERFLEEANECVN